MVSLKKKRRQMFEARLNWVYYVTANADQSNDTECRKGPEPFLLANHFEVGVGRALQMLTENILLPSNNLET